MVIENKKNDRILCEFDIFSFNNIHWLMHFFYDSIHEHKVKLHRNIGNNNDQCRM